MKKKKLNSKDGSEFTVFYLKSKESEPNKMNDKEAFAEQNMGAVFEFGDTLPKKLPITSFFGSSEGSYKALIDDTIDRDFLDTASLVVGRVYRVPSLNNLIVRYNGRYDKPMLDTTPVMLKVAHNDFHFWVNEKSLVKASKDEVNFFLNKIM